MLYYSHQIRFFTCLVCKKYQHNYDIVTQSTRKIITSEAWNDHF